MKIIDTFIFYNELTLLKYRLNLLNDIVDYFVIVEATKTHKGEEKPLFYSFNKNFFIEFASKIIHVVVTDLVSIDNNNIDVLSNNNQYWKNEIYQRNCINNGISKLKLEKNDYIIISDCDEIPDPNTLKIIKYQNIIFDHVILNQSLYYYNLNCKHYSNNSNNSVWSLSKIISYECYKNDYNCLPNNCRKINLNDNYIIKGGWHLSYFGNSKFIQNKVKQFAHQELNNNDNTNLDHIEQSIKQHKQFFDDNQNDSSNKTYILYTPISENDYLPPLYNIYLTDFY
jgi:beta-1,4-mannosyl-glycoprotein beta-1,4-N-acetylglucosaminyltransferase